MAARYWLFKSEPSSFSIDDLARAPRKTTAWNGVRNYQARNLLRDEVRPGDGVLFYHSNADPAAVAGTAVVTRGGYPDDSQFDPRSEYADPAASPEAPRWFVVDVRFEEKFKRLVPLDELRRIPALSDMVLLQRGSRLSVQPVTTSQWQLIVKLGRRV